jgi:signal transduction histidine kinase
MQIWKKLMIGFSLYASLATALSLFAYSALHEITTRLITVRTSNYMPDTVIADIDVLLTRATFLILLSILTIIILGTIINMKLAKSIVDPVKHLEEVTNKVAAGDLSKRIEIQGKGEIASLGVSFNRMQERLVDTMRFLELASEKLKESRAKLVESEKLATLGRFSAGIAHEINNPLAIINEKAGLMKDYLNMSEEFPNKEKFLNMLDAIFNSVIRCRTITHRILGFARKTDITRETINLNNLLKEVLGFIEKDILYKSIRIETDLQKDLPEFTSDKIHLQQVFLNIIKNAVDAVEEGGFIRIATRIKNEKTIQATVTDNGHGIPSEALKHIFEPFFTTKEKGKGTGLGLSITYGIMKQLGGNISVQSEPGKETSFIIDMPV